MKKVILITLPLIVVIALIFSIQNRNFTATGFINYLSTIRFNNFGEQLRSTSETLNEVGEQFRSAYASDNPLSFLYHTMMGLINWVIGVGKITFSIGALLRDLVENISSITHYLLIS